LHLFFFPKLKKPLALSFHTPYLVLALTETTTYSVF
jgi:hypothetical protein